jgi:hypothetical protein
MVIPDSYALQKDGSKVFQPAYTRRQNSKYQLQETSRIPLGDQLYPSKEQADKYVEEYFAELKDDVYNCEDPTCPLPKPHLHARAEG